jgi:RHS repeat-associated protein
MRWMTGALGYAPQPQREYNEHARPQGSSALNQGAVARTDREALRSAVERICADGQCDREPRVGREAAGVIAVELRGVARPMVQRTSRAPPGGLWSVLMLADLERSRHPASSPSRLSRRGWDRCGGSGSHRVLHAARRARRWGLGCRKSLHTLGPSCVPGRVVGRQDVFEQINSSGTVFYLHHDQQGSTRLLTNSGGKFETAFTYDAYGNTTGKTGANVPAPLGYDGQYTSSDTGLIYLRVRGYDPTTAQFLSRDRLEMYTDGPYFYAGDNPLNYGDPSGLSSERPEEGIRCPNPVCFPFPNHQERQHAVEALEGVGHEIGHAASEIGQGITSAWNAVFNESESSKESAQAEPSQECGEVGFTGNQDALIKIAKEAKRNGLSPEDAEALREWAEEYEVPFRGPETHPGRGFGSLPHITSDLSTTSRLGDKMQGAVDIETGALILTVDAEGLQELVGLLQRSEATTVPLGSTPEHHATRSIGMLSLEPLGDSAVAIAIDDDVATITGSPASLARLAHEVREFGDYNDLFEPGMHAHFDPAGGVLVQGSEPLIVAGPVPDEAGRD